jgi:hypothetical protein
VGAGLCVPGGTHGSTTKLAHALTALIVDAYRAGGGELPEMIAARVERLFDSDAEDAAARHEEIANAMTDLSRLLGERARAGGVQLSSLPALGGRLGAVAFAAALRAPYLATAHHHADSRQSLASIERGFFGVAADEAGPRALVFTDTFAEVNGVAGTMRRLAAAFARGKLGGAVVCAGDERVPGTVGLCVDWAAALSGVRIAGARVSRADRRPRVRRARGSRCRARSGRCFSKPPRRACRSLQSRRAAPWISSRTG